MIETHSCFPSIRGLLKLRGIPFYQFSLHPLLGVQFINMIFIDILRALGRHFREMLNLYILVEHVHARVFVGNPWVPK